MSSYMCMRTIQSAPNSNPPHALDRCIALQTLIVRVQAIFKLLQTSVFRMHAVFLLQQHSMLRIQVRNHITQQPKSCKCYVPVAYTLSSHHSRLLILNTSPYSSYFALVVFNPRTIPHVCAGERACDE